MLGIPLALGGSAYFFISVVGRRSIMCGAFSIFFPPVPTLCFPLCISVTGARLLRGVGTHGWVARFCQPSVQSPSGLQITARQRTMSGQK